MGSLADYIEGYLKRLIDEAAQGFIEIQRRELARRFRCVPSQINYVLSTRFTLDRGYLVETRRGGGGYIRILKVELGPEDILAKVLGEIGSEITEDEAEVLLIRLQNVGLIDGNERAFVKFVLYRETEELTPEIECKVRARLLKAVLTLLLR